MTDKERIKMVFQDFVDGGLVSQDIDKVFRCISDQVIGIGIGEQGFVLSPEDIRRVLLAGMREDDRAVYSLEYNQLHILVHGGMFAHACGEITINRTEDGVLTRSGLLQSLVFTKESGDWKICGLHASVPVITEENINAYPLRVAEKMLQSLREEIGEKAYLAEEQFQQAVLADTIAFYIINLSKNCFEKCHVDSEFCVYAEPGTPYEAFILEKSPIYLSAEDKARFWEAFSLKRIQEAIANGEKEIRCEYMLKNPAGGAIWAVSVIRLIVDCVTGDHKGIMYVKDIDRQKRRELEMRAKAERDSMTGLYNKTAFEREVAKALSRPEGRPGILIMLDVDDFKVINDTWGHPCGDKVLTAVAGFLEEQFQGDHISGRLGGDEFGVFVSGKEVSELTEDPVRDLMEQFRRIPMPDYMDIPMSCSIGISGTDNVGSFEQLYEQADQALYQSKQEGKNRCTIYGQGNRQ